MNQQQKYLQAMNWEQKSEKPIREEIICREWMKFLTALYYRRFQNPFLMKFSMVYFLGKM